jgi:hypothetical protein
MVARMLGDDIEPLTRSMHQLWRKIRQELWGETWNFWRKL